MMKKYLTIVMSVALLIGLYGATAEAQVPSAITELPETPSQSIFRIFAIPVDICFSVLQLALAVPVYVFRSFAGMMSDLGFPLDQLLGGFSVYAPQIFMDSLIMFGFLAMITFFGSWLFPIPVLGIFCCPLWWSLEALATLLFAVVDFFVKAGRTTSRQRSVVGGVLGA